MCCRVGEIKNIVYYDNFRRGKNLKKYEESMNSDRDNIDVEAYRKKDIYSAEEKQMIMDRLNEERLIHQQASKGIDGKKAIYDQSEKNKILNKLNEQRLSQQKREEIKESRTANKEVYKFGSKTFYKFVHMEREYYIEISDCDKLSSRAAIITLYYRTFDELKKKDVLIKTEIYSNKFFISYDAIRVYFKSYALENARKK
jgi:hypothetical protein